MTYQEFFSRYTYDRRGDKIADGRFGAIYIANDAESGATVCVRVMIADDEGACAALTDEADYAAKLPDDERFVRYRDVNRFQEATGYVSCAVMPYYPLGTLDRVLEEWKLDDDEKRVLSDALMGAARLLRDNGLEVPRFDPTHIFISEEDGKLVPHLFDLTGAATDNGSFEEDVRKALPYNDIPESGAEDAADPVEVYEDNASTARKWKLLGGVIATWAAIIALIGFVHCQRNSGGDTPRPDAADTVQHPLYPADEYVMEEAARADSIAKAKADSIAAFKADSVAYMKKIAAEREARAKEREESRRREAERASASAAVADESTAAPAQTPETQTPVQPEVTED